jgi:hypothetical protein
MQPALSATLGMVPSRLVALLDELEEKGLTERRENPGDRRSYALHLTEKGRSVLAMIGRISREHQQALLNALSENEEKELADLPQRVADEQGLTRGVHPGYARTASSRCARKLKARQRVSYSWRLFPLSCARSSRLFPSVRRAIA